MQSRSQRKNNARMLREESQVPGTSWDQSSYRNNSSPGLTCEKHRRVKMSFCRPDTFGPGHERSRALVEQEAGDLVLFNVNPGPHGRITHSSIGEVDEKRLRELDPATDFNRVGSTEIYFYSF